VLSVVHQDLLTAQETYLCHQINCVTRRAAFLAQAIFHQFPYADVYKSRPYRYLTDNPPPTQKPGNIIISGNGHDRRYIAGLLGQVYPGKPRFPVGGLDGHKAREDHFLHCLQFLEALYIKKGGSFAFPFGIGCGAAGGSWPKYQQLLERFQEATEAKVVLYKLKP
jgi:hypothetical protein